MNLSFIRSNLEVPKTSHHPQHGFETLLYYHYITLIFLQLGNLEALIQTRLSWKVLVMSLVWDNVTEIESNIFGKVQLGNMEDK